MKTANKLNYIFNRFLHTGNGVIHDILLGGSKVGEHPHCRFFATADIKQSTYAPSRDLVVASDLYDKLVMGGGASASEFKEFQSVVVYNVDPLDYPKELDRFVLRDDLEDIVWRKLSRARSSVQPRFYEFCPKIITYPEMVSANDGVKSRIEYEEIDEDGIVDFSVKTIEWSPRLVASTVNSWVGGGYFVCDRFLEIIYSSLDKRMWRVASIEMPGSGSSP